MAIRLTVPLLDHFAALKDPRQHAKVLCPLPEILLLVLSATLAGADDFVETTLWGAEHLAYLRRFYPYDKGIPSHDTLCDVFAALDPELYKSCFMAWIDGLRGCCFIMPPGLSEHDRADCAECKRSNSLFDRMVSEGVRFSSLSSSGTPLAGPCNKVMQ